MEFSQPAITAAMRFRTWHLMATVALWVPLAQWLLALEAQDYPSKPQTIFNVVGFYGGSVLIACLPRVIAWIWTSAIRERKRRDSSFTYLL